MQAYYSLAEISEAESGSVGACQRDPAFHPTAYRRIRRRRSQPDGTLPGARARLAWSGAARYRPLHPGDSADVIVGIVEPSSAVAARRRAAAHFVLLNSSEPEFGMRSGSYEFQCEILATRALSGAIWRRQFGLERRYSLFQALQELRHPLHADDYPGFGTRAFKRCQRLRLDVPYARAWSIPTHDRNHLIKASCLTEYICDLRSAPAHAQCPLLAWMLKLFYHSSI
jgi:hypothetical protein